MAPAARLFACLALPFFLGGCGLIFSKKTKNGKPSHHAVSGDATASSASTLAFLRGAWLSACQPVEKVTLATLTGQGAHRYQFEVTGSTAILSEFMFYDTACKNASFVRTSRIGFRGASADGANLYLQLSNSPMIHEKTILEKALVPIFNWSRDCKREAWAAGRPAKVGDSCQLWYMSSGDLVGITRASDKSIKMSSPSVLLHKAVALPWRVSDKKGVGVPVTFSGDWKGECIDRTMHFSSYPDPKSYVVTSVIYHDAECRRPKFALREAGRISFIAMSREGVNFMMERTKESLIPIGTGTASLFRDVKYKGFDGWQAGEEHVLKVSSEGSPPLDSDEQTFSFSNDSGPRWLGNKIEPGTPQLAAYDDSEFGAQSEADLANDMKVAQPVQSVAPAVVPSPEVAAFAGEVTARSPAGAAHTHHAESVLIKGKRLTSACRLGSWIFASHVAPNEGIVRSGDGGRTWFMVRPGAFHVACGKGGQLAAIDENGRLVTSYDAGANWIRILTDQALGPIGQASDGSIVATGGTNRFALAPSGPTGTWQVRTAPDLMETSEGGLHVAPGGSVSYFASAEGVTKAYRFDFEGNASVKLAPHFPNGEAAVSLTSLIFSGPSNGLLSYRNTEAGSEGLLLTEDGGRNWVEAMTPQAIAATFGAQTARPFQTMTNTMDSLRYFVVQDAGEGQLRLRSSRDAGKTWLEATPTFPLSVGSTWADLSVPSKDFSFTGYFESASGLLLIQKANLSDSQIVLFDPK